MSRPGYAGKTALCNPNTASPSTKRAAAELRVPIQASNARHLDRRPGLLAVTADTEASLPAKPDRRGNFDYGSSRRRRSPMIERRKDVKKI
jgi:hypothetical protein